MSQFACAIFSFAITLALIYSLAPLALRAGLVDAPDHRKPHRGLVPLVGGLAIFLCMLFGYMLFGWPDETHLGLTKPISLTYLTAFAILVAAGVIDDMRGMSVTLRVVLEFGVVILLIEGAGLRLQSLGDLVGLGQILLPHWLTYPFLMIAIFGIINAYNMLDGMDGLLSFNTLIALVAFHTLSGVPWGTGSTAVAMGLVAFLLSNLSLIPGIPKTFLGDAGSKFLGLFVAVLLVTAASGSIGDKVIYPVTALYVAGLPLMDMVFVTLKRVRDGHSPFSPGNVHIHDLSRALGLGTFGSNVMICGIGITLPLLGMFLQRNGASEATQFAIFLVLFALYSAGASVLWRRAGSKTAMTPQPERG